MVPPLQGEPLMAAVRRTSSMGEDAAAKREEEKAGQGEWGLKIFRKS